ncbi:non-homologous end-joining DNA ligase [Paenibacillus sp. strain BS8-2]
MPAFVPTSPRTKEGTFLGHFVIVGYRETDERFMAGLRVGNEWVAVGSFREGLQSEERAALAQAIQSRTEGDGDCVGYAPIQPGISVELSFLMPGGARWRQLVEQMPDTVWEKPVFRAFRFKEKAESCTWNRLLLENADTRPKAKISHPRKALWSAADLDKESYAAYLTEIAPRMLPFLQDRALTVIRYPHGVPGESFYQKNCPAYAPEFVRAELVEGIRHIVCDDLSTLVWLGNQSAIELHVPFQTVNEPNPLEIVFDLDPPSPNEFGLAVRAALEIHLVLESFGIVGYPKLSGGKGLQIHIPLGSRLQLTYNDTRVFLSFVAEYLVQKHPALFTIERLKKKRGGRLYVDYIQHAQGKTIICPYSARGTTEGTVAAPLEWNEVNERLSPEQFTIPKVLKGLFERPCPMRDYYDQTNEAIGLLIEQLRVQSVRGPI